MEYRLQKLLRAGAQRKLVSPPLPSPYYATQMLRVGAAREENAPRFVYSRCAICGDTVRRFQAPDPGGIARHLFNHVPSHGPERLHQARCLKG